MQGPESKPLWVSYGGQQGASEPEAGKTGGARSGPSRPCSRLDALQQGAAFQPGCCVENRLEGTHEGKRLGGSYNGSY